MHSTSIVQFQSRGQKRLNVSEAEDRNDPCDRSDQGGRVWVNVHISQGPDGDAASQCCVLNVYLDGLNLIELN